MDYSYDYTYAAPTTSSVDGATAAVVFAILGLFFLLFIVIVYAISAWLLGRIFKKAGVAQWIAWVPIYNNWKLLEIGGQPGFWAVLALIPFVSIVSAIFTYIAMYHIGKKLGKEDWFVILAIFIPIIWAIWLAFDDSKWPSSEKLSKVSPKAKQSL